MSQYSGTKKLYGEEFASELFTDLYYLAVYFISCRASILSAKDWKFALID